MLHVSETDAAELAALRSERDRLRALVRRAEALVQTDARSDDGDTGDKWHTDAELEYAR